MLGEGGLGNPAPKMQRKGKGARTTGGLLGEGAAMLRCAAGVAGAPEMPAAGAPQALCAYVVRKRNELMGACAAALDTVLTAIQCLRHATMIPSLTSHRNKGTSSVHASTPCQTMPATCHDASSSDQPQEQRHELSACICPVSDRLCSCSPDITDLADWNLSRGYHAACTSIDSANAAVSSADSSFIFMGAYEAPCGWYVSAPNAALVTDVLPSWCLGAWKPPRPAHVEIHRVDSSQ